MPESAEKAVSLERPQRLDGAHRAVNAGLGEDSDRAQLRFAIAAVTVGGCAGIVALALLDSLLGGIVVFLAYPFVAKLLLRPMRAAARFKVGSLSPYHADEAAVAALFWPVGFLLYVPFALFVGLVRKLP
jgi:hypothetical protein